MTLMLEHVDSPYIRCLGLLYLRYAADPGSLWSWFAPYLHDEEAVQVRQGQAETTLGQYARSLLTELEYHGTRLPRLPLAVERHFKVKLLQAERTEARARRHFANGAAMEYFQKVGARVQALYFDDENPSTWYDAVVERVIMRDGDSGNLLARPTFQVHFPEYGNTEVVSLGEVDLPGSNDAKPPPTASASYDPKGDRDRGRGYGDGCGTDRRGRGRDDYGGHRGRRDDRYDRGEKDARGSRGYPDERSGESRSRGDRYNPSERDRRRERSRSRDRGDNLNDARREEQELMEEVLRRERDKTAAKGRSYAARPATFKESLGTSGMQSRHLAQGSDWRPRGNEAKPKARGGTMKDSKPAAAPAVPKTAAELAAIEDKKRMLRARYG